VHTYYSGNILTPAAAHLIYVLLTSPRSCTIQKFSNLTSLSMSVIDYSGGDDGGGD